MVISVGECGDQMKTNYKVLLVGINSTSVDQVFQTIVSVGANS